MANTKKITIISDDLYHPRNRRYSKSKYYDILKIINPLSKENIFDSDFIIIDIENFFKSYGYLLNDFISEGSFYSYSIRNSCFPQINQDFKEILQSKKSIYFITWEESPLNRNIPIDSVSMILPFDIYISDYTGKEVQCINQKYQDFYKKLKDFFKYRAYYSNLPQQNEKTTVSEIFCIENNPNRILGFEWSEGSGKIVFLPYLDLDSEALDILIEAITELENPEKREYFLPEWSNNYKIPSEKETSQEIEKLNKELEKIDKDISGKNQRLLELQNMKALFSGDGIPLEEQCLKVFLELGFKQIPGKKNRSDLILSYGDKFAVVEIKGLSKSAAEKNSAQLEKWVSEFIYEHGNKNLKGILVVNGYKDTHLEQRNQPVFPHSMVEFSKKRDHCLISGLQFACIYFDILKNPEKKPEIVEKIFDTIGVFEGYENWKDYIEYIPEKL
ncbi:hypothetical protein J2128_000537 [Methanomicrobium sp. W14]|uniref:hypothetical protein n=1 Tax=Methanomicrobium sp. W14 TaxID=2817839 RepID=UPI001AE72D25|nr:hypothetical protein [Methanomicrobium sp. W14]MBP2132616.1 hypothetical protein [Methanomicrobium sp. W14]